jgi:uncharacterized protein DUF3592
MTRNFDQGIPRWAGITLIVLGSALAAPVIFHDTRLVLQGTRTSGIIVGSQPSRQPGVSTVPLVRFTADTGKVITFRGSPQNSAYTVGQRVTVFYRPVDPAHAEIYSWQSLWLGLCFVIVFSGGLVIGGAVILKRRSKSVRSESNAPKPINSW